MATELQNIIEIGSGSDALRLWTGRGTISVAGEQHFGTGAALELSRIEQRRGDPDRRATLTLGVVPLESRAVFLQDSGPIPVMIRWATITRSGQAISVNLLSPVFRGKVSDPTMQDGVLTVEVETLQGDRLSAVPLTWSDADHQRRFPGDRTFEHARALSERGIEGAWPP